MPQSLRVDDGTRGLPYHFIQFVDDVELLFHKMTCQKSKVKSRTFDL